MTVTSLLADMLASIKNAQTAGLSSIKVRYSSFNVAVLSVMQDEGYIASFSKIEEGVRKFLNISLKYYEDLPVISMLRLVSRPSCRKYCGVRVLKKRKVRSGLGVAILSTSLGVLSDYDACAKGVGGEILCEIF